MNWEDEKESLKAARDAASRAQERAIQKHTIVVNQQVDLWNSLTQEFISMVGSVNIGSSPPLVTFSQIPRSPDFRVKALRPEQTPMATVHFDPKLYRVTIMFTGCGDAISQKYEVGVNENNRAHYVNSKREPLTTVDIKSVKPSHG